MHAHGVGVAQVCEGAAAGAAPRGERPEVALHVVLVHRGLVLVLCHTVQQRDIQRSAARGCAGHGQW